MSSTTSSIAGAGPGGPAIITTAGGPGGAPPVTIATFQNADVLIVAVPHGIGAGTGAGGVHARRPVRPQASAGWAPNRTSATASKTTQAIASTAKKTSTSTAKKTTSTSTTSASKSSSSTKSSGPLAFLDDKNLSVEEKLFRFLCYVADKNEKALEKKLEEVSGKGKETGSTKSSSSGGKGLLGNLLGGGGGGLLGGLLGGKGGGISGLLGNVFSVAGIGTDLLKSSGLMDVVGQLSGPVLAAGATALGFPMLAPALMQAGPALAKGAMSLVGDAVEQKSASKPESSSTSSSSSTNKDPDISQKDLMEIQRLQDKQKEAFGMVSNMLRAMHETKMAVINNLRA